MKTCPKITFLPGLLIIVTAAVAAVALFSFLWRKPSDQTPITFLNSAEAWREYQTAIKPWGSLFAAGQWGMENLTNNEQEIRYIELGNQSSSNEKVGIEFKALGFDARATKDDSWLRVPAVPNIAQRIVVKIVAQGAAYDAATYGATASCVTFDLLPNQLAKIPVLLAAQDIRGLTDETYAVLVKTGADVACQTERSSNNQPIWTGLLASHGGTELKLESLSLSGGRL
jgi:hypothetical protein